MITYFVSTNRMLMADPSIEAGRDKHNVWCKIPAMMMTIIIRR